MLNQSLLMATVITMLASVACGNASFFGGGNASRKETVTAGQNPNGQTTNGQNPNGQTTNGQTQNGQTQNGQTTNGQTQNGQTTNSQTQNGQTPNGQTTNGQIPTTGQTTQTGPVDQISQPTPNSIVFGQDKVFHIGDGRYVNTSCKDRVAQLPLNGTAYFFQFEVLNDNTTVNISVAEICGVDYTTNLLEVYGLYSRLQSQYIPLNATTAAGNAIKLNKGFYSIQLTSGVGQDGDSAPDRDDYIVGKVTVSGDRAVRPIRYGAYNR